MQPSVAPTIEVRVGAKTLTLCFTHRAYKALGADPYNGTFAEFMQSVDMEKAQRLLWAGQIQANRSIRFEDVEEDMLDLSPAQFVDVISQLVSQLRPKDQAPEGNRPAA